MEATENADVDKGKPGPEGTGELDLATGPGRFRPCRSSPTWSRRAITASARVVSEGVTPANPIITKVPPAYEIRRNSDGQTFEVYGGSGHQQTAVVYDAGVTSYAWGICLYQGSSFTARTINY